CAGDALLRIGGQVVDLGSAVDVHELPGAVSHAVCAGHEPAEEHGARASRPLRGTRRAQARSLRLCGGWQTEEIEHRRQDVDQARRVRAAASAGYAGTADHERHAELLFVPAEAVLDQAVLAE